MELVIAWAGELDEEAYNATIQQLGIHDAVVEVLDYTILPACHILCLAVGM